MHLVVCTVDANLRHVRSILDANYLHRDLALGESAIRKLEQVTS
jgi:hypothetical protein